MKIRHLALVLALALVLPACGKNEEKKAPVASEEIAPASGPVILDGSAKDQAQKTADQAVAEKVRERREQVARDMGKDPKTGKRIGKFKSSEDNWATGFKP